MWWLPWHRPASHQCSQTGPEAEARGAGRLIGFLIGILIETKFVLENNDYQDILDSS